MNAMSGGGYRNQGKLRAKKFRQEQERRGYKSISVFISKQFLEELDRLKTEKGLNRQDAMDYIFKGYNNNVTRNATNTDNKGTHNPIKKRLPGGAQKAKDITPGVSDAKPKDAPRDSDLSKAGPQKLSIEDRDQSVFKAYKRFPGNRAQERIDWLNNKGILFTDSPWTKKNLSDQFFQAKKRKKNRLKK